MLLVSTASTSLLQQFTYFGFASSFQVLKTHQLTNRRYAFLNLFHIANSIATPILFVSCNFEFEDNISKAYHVKGFSFLVK